MVQTFETIITGDGSDTDAASSGVSRGIANSMFETFGCGDQLLATVVRAFESLPNFDMNHTSCKRIMKSIAEAFSSSSEFGTQFEATDIENDPFCWDSPARSKRTRKRHRASLIDKALKCQQNRPLKDEQIDTQEKSGPAYIRFSELVADWSCYHEDVDKSDARYRHQVVGVSSTRTKHVWKTSLIDIARSRQSQKEIQLQCERVGAEQFDCPALPLRSTIDSYPSPGTTEISFCSLCETTKGISACGLCKLRR